MEWTAVRTEVISWHTVPIVGPKWPGRVGGGAGEGGEGADGDVAATQADQGVLVTSRWKLVQVCTGEEKGEGREEEGGDEWTDKGLKECIVKE